jgi:drug/metabolite transporter (DMT)-like permease
MQKSIYVIRAGGSFFEFVFAGRKLTTAAAVVGVVIATVFWGLGNVAQKIALDDVPPAMLAAIRAVATLICLAPFAHWELRKSGAEIQKLKTHWPCALVVISSFSMAFTLQSFGGLFTSASNLGFLVNLSVLLTPLLLFAVCRERLSRSAIAACVVCFIGVFMLTGFDFEEPNMGDVMCVGAAFFFAIWVIALDRFLAAVSLPFTISALQFLPVALNCGYISFVRYDIDFIPIAPVLPALIFVSLFGTCISFLLATLSQRVLQPATTTILFSLEALFGAVGAYFILQEQMSTMNMAGGLLIFASIAVSQWRVA